MFTPAAIAPFSPSAVEVAGVTFGSMYSLGLSLVPSDYSYYTANETQVEPAASSGVNDAGMSRTSEGRVPTSAGATLEFRGLTQGTGSFVDVVSAVAPPSKSYLQDPESAPKIVETAGADLFGTSLVFPEVNSEGEALNLAALACVAAALTWLLFSMARVQRSPR
jgi:hypothetical protein